MYSPKYNLTNKILSKIGLVEAARAVIANAPLVPAWEAKFREDALVRTVHHGTHIEGNELNIDEAQRVIEGKQVVGRERDIQEVINYRNVVKYLGEVTSESTEKIFSKEVLRKIHKLTVERLLPAQKCGEIRKGAVVVRNSATGEVSFRPPLASEVPRLMEEFFAWARKTNTEETHPVIKAGIVQYEVVRIHPFVDGNGRVARAFTTLSLFRDNYDIRRFFSLEEYYDHNTTSYYDALQAVSMGKGDQTPWLEYFTGGLAIEFNRVKERVQRLSTDLHIKERIGGKQIYLTERQITLVEYIQKAGFLQNQTFPELFPKVSEDTILRDLKILVEGGIIVKRGKTKAARYVMKT